MASTTPGRRAAPPTNIASEFTTGPGSMALCHGESLPATPGLPRTLAESLSHAARVGPDDAIVYHRANNRTQVQSYSLLLDRARRIHSGLVAAGLAPADVVLLQLSDAQDVIEAFWGCVLGGFRPLIVPVPPSYREPHGALDKLLAVNDFLGRPMLVTSEASIDELSAAVGPGAGEARVASLESLSQHDPAAEPHAADPHDVALLNLSSGSTGRPKCIALTHHNLLSRAAGTNWLCGHRTYDRALNWLPFDHIGSISDWHIRCVALPCRTVYAQTTEVLARPAIWLELMAHYRITHSWAPNFAYALVRDAARSRTDHPYDLSCVRSLLTAGESVTSAVVDGFLDALAPAGLARSAIRPAFGMAELGSGVTYAVGERERSIITHTIAPAAIGQPVQRVDAADPAAKTFADLGPVIPGVAMRIVDEENNVLAEDAVGRLQIRGSAVFTGYLNDSDASADAFTQDGWFNTGDVGFITGGRLVITGREKETIVINGANFHNHELEAVVERVPGVDVSYTAACAVRHAQGASEAVAVFFHPISQDEAAWTALLGEIRAALVRSVGVNPQYIVPVQRADIPKTSIGKIQRSALARRFENGDFQPILDQLQQAAAARSATAAAPGDQRQRMIIRVWQDVLGVERIGIHDSFFDLGGQSLHLAQVRAKLMDEYQVDVTLVTLLAHPTVSSLAGHLGEQDDDGATFQRAREQLRVRKTAAASRRERRMAAREAAAARRTVA